MVSKLSVSTWLFVTIVFSPLAQLVLKSGPSQASIIRTEPPSQQRKELHAQDQAQAQENHFILLTTGGQIKLYQTRKSSLASPDSWSLTGRSFVINSTSSLTAFAKHGDPYVSILGNNSYSRWLAELNSLSSSKASILPGNRLDDVDYTSTKSGWRKPFITDVDYFFDDSFCPPGWRANSQVTPFQCMVIVWLDKSNNFLHYGSLNLTSHLMSSKVDTNQHKAKVVDLLEFPPVDLLKISGQDSRQYISKPRNFTPQAYSFLVQRRQHWIRVAFSDGTQPMANQILSGQLKDYLEVFEMSGLSGEPLLSTEITDFNGDCEPLIGSNRTLKNLSIDEENNWLFYLDQSRGGTIFALGPRYQYEEQVTTLHTFVVGNIRKRATTVDTITSMTLDSEGRRLIWLTENNTIYSSDLAGETAVIIGQLSARPLIRSPSTIQLFHDTLFISDPVRRALLAYDMRAYETESDRSKPTHEVLLVDMPAVFGFRLIDITSESAISRELDLTDKDPEYKEDNKARQEVKVKRVDTWFPYYSGYNQPNVKTLYTYRLGLRTRQGDDCADHFYSYAPDHLDLFQLLLVPAFIIVSAVFYALYGLPRCRVADKSPEV